MIANKIILKRSNNIYIVIITISGGLRTIPHRLTLNLSNLESWSANTIYHPENRFLFLATGGNKPIQLKN